MIYFDNNATTQVPEHVVEAMRPYFTDCYYNASASSATFTGADRPRQLAANALARALSAEDEAFIFTSGATESNNWVFASVANQAKRGRIVVSSVEHSSVSEPATELSQRGFEVVHLPVDRRGVIILDGLDEIFTDDVVLVSAILANNETGVLQPIQELGELIRKHSPSALFHTDATQAIGKIPVDLRGSLQEIDLLSFSAHKFHGPKGVGGLYLRPGVDLYPLLKGGGQENGLRSGTINTPGLLGLAMAVKDLPMEGSKIKNLRNVFERELLSRFPNAIIHSQSADRLPNTSCFSVPGINASEVAEALASRGIIVGTGSACSSGSLRPPATLLAMGVNYDLARAALRVSLSTRNTMLEVSELLSVLQKLIGSTDSLHANVQCSA